MLIPRRNAPHWPSRRRAILLACLLLVVTVAPSNAGNFGSNVTSGGTAGHACDASSASQCVADNGVHNVRNQGLGTWYNAVNYAVGQWNLDATVLVAWVAGGSPDVEAFDFNYGNNGIWGWTSCGDGAAYGGSNPDRWCKPQNAEFNEFYSHTSGQRDIIAKHELGHSLGLRHAPNSGATYHDVMVKDQKSWGTISTHDHDRLAEQYDAP